MNKKNEITEQINSEPLLKEWNQTAKQLLKVISLFSDENFNTIPYEGSWTAAQVCDHVAKSLTGAVTVLNQQNHPSERKYDQFVEQLKSIFLNFDNKYQSPSSILPEEKPMNKEKMFQRIEELSKQISEAAETLDLSQLCSLYPFFGIGELTRFEWVYFSCVHTQRHTVQLQKVLQSFK